MGASVEKQTTISVFVIKMSLMFWWPSSVILMPGLICPVSGAKGAAEKHSNNASARRNGFMKCSLFALNFTKCTH